SSTISRCGRGMSSRSCSASRCSFCGFLAEPGRVAPSPRSLPPAGCSSHGPTFSPTTAPSHWPPAISPRSPLPVWTGLIRNRLSLRPGRDAAGAAGLCIFVLALFAWPLVGRVLGRPWPQAEIFGIAPDPTVVATLGVLIAADRTHWELLLVPLLWC